MYGEEGATIVGFEGISIISLRSDAYENEIIKTAAQIATHGNNLISSGYAIDGVDLTKEADRMLSLPTIIESFISRNYSTNGVGTGKGSDGNYTESHPGLSTRSYIINFAVRKKSQNPNEFEILWASLNDGKKDRFLGVGFQRFLDSDPINHITTLHYFYWHQQILNNLDRSIDLTHLDFVAAYHYPIVDVSEIVSSNIKSAPFESKNGEDAASAYLVRPKPKKCGLKKNSFNFEPPSMSEMLQNSFSPINYNFPVINITFFSLGPPCPARPTAGMEPLFPLTYDKRVQRLKDRILNTKENWQNLWKEGKEAFDHVGDYYTGEEFKNDLEKRFSKTGTTEMKLRKIGDLVLNQFSLEKMLQLVCICVAQIADDALAEAGYEPWIPEGTLSVKGPGVKFDPSMLSDDDPNFGLAEAFEGTMGSMDPPFGSSPFDKKAFKLQELCSICICLPDILVRLPTFDLLKSVMKMILDLIEALIVQILMSLVMQLLDWLLKCPDYKCELGVKTPIAAINDYGSHDLEDLLGADIACPIFDELDATGTDISSIKSLLVKKISSELTSGELANLLAGYPTKTVVYVVKDMVEYVDEFEALRPYLSTEASIESFLGCLVDALDPAAVSGFEVEVSDPEYCPSPDNTPAAYMSDKCDNEGETERFLLRERAAAAANIRALVDAFKNDPSFMGKLMPTPWTTVCADGTKIKGFLADDKFKPKVTDTMIETVINPMVDTINKAASRDGVSLIKNFQQRDPKRETRVNLNDTEKVVLSTAQLATSLALAVWTPPAGIAIAPLSWTKSINTQYPAIGGLKFQEKIKNFEQHINVYYPEYDADEGLGGKPATWSGVEISDPADRRFDQRFKFKLPTTNIWLYLETLTPKLLDTDTDHGGFQNHVVVKIDPLADPNYELPAGVADLPDGHPAKLWYESRFTPLFGDTQDINFSYKTPMEDINIPAGFSLSAPAGQISYSPQSQVFSQMLQNGLGPVWDTIAPAIKTNIARQFESSLHMYAMRDFIEKLGNAAADSPFFRTYTYEEIKSGVHNLKFSHLEATNPYSDFGAGVFKQKYGAKDKNGRTKVYYEPRAAINDTPLRKRAIDLIKTNDLRDRIKDMWDWTEAYDPDDPNSLPPLSIAIIDGLVEELIRLYCVEALIKATPAETVFDSSKTSEVRDAMFTTVLSKIIEKDIEDTFPIETFTNSITGNEIEDTFQTELYGYIDSFVARKYMNMGLSANDAPTGAAAIAAMIDGIGDDEGLLKSAGTTAKTATTIYHLQKVNVQGTDGAGQDLDLPNPLEYVVAPNPEPFLDEAPSIAPPMKTFHVATVLEPPEGYGSSIPITKPRFSDVGDLTNGGFVYERYIKITLHEDTKDFFQNHFAWYPNFSDVNGDPVPISLEGSQDVDISATPTGGSNFASIASHLYAWITEFGKRDIMKDNFPKAADQLLNAVSITGDGGLFQSLTHHVRMSYVMTGGAQGLDDVVDAVKEAALIDQFVNAGSAGLGSVFEKAIKSNKSYMLNEATLNESTGAIVENNYVIVLPIVESPGNKPSPGRESDRLGLDTNPRYLPSGPPGRE